MKAGPFGLTVLGFGILIAAILLLSFTLQQTDVWTWTTTGYAAGTAACFLLTTFMVSAAQEEKLSWPNWPFINMNKYGGDDFGEYDDDE